MKKVKIMGILLPLFVIAPVFAKSTPDKILNPRLYLESQRTYQLSSTWKKLEMLDQLIQGRKVSSNATWPLRRELMIKYIDEQSKADPVKRLDALKNLSKLRSIAGSDSSLQRQIIEDYITNNQPYQNANPEGKLAILIKLDEEQPNGTRWWANQMASVRSRLIMDKTGKLPPERKGMAILKILRDLKNKNLNDKWFHKADMQHALSLHLAYNQIFQINSPKVKLDYLKKLEQEDLISSFIRSEFEIPYVVKYYKSNHRFIMLPDKISQIDFIKDERKKGEFHLFSEATVLKRLGLK